ncbi:MAG TPA: hypothetical protein VMU25_04555 [Candidatus Paceibacterota bacterium]|nr:hypothetical protein [Candidatus Paceibacterota bacterium]
MKKIISVGLLSIFLPLTAFAATSATSSIGSGNVHASVQINGVAVAGVTNVGNLQADVQYYQNNTSVKNHTYSLTITKKYSASDALSKWSKAKTSRKSVSVIFRNDAGTELARVNFSNCTATKFTKSGSSESLGVQCTQLSLAQ